MADIKIIDTTDDEDFENEVNKYLKDGYKIISSNIGFVNSDRYNFCSCYQAMMLKGQKSQKGVNHGI